MIKPDAFVESGVTIITLGSEFEAIPHTVVCQFDEVLELAAAG